MIRGYTNELGMSDRDTEGIIHLMDSCLRINPADRLDVETLINCEKSDWLWEDEEFDFDNDDDGA